MRGVPRLRRAISSAAPPSSMSTLSSRAERCTMRCQLLDVVVVQPQHQAEAAAQRRAHQALARGGADGGEARDGQRVRARARSGADQNVHAEILERRVEHLLDVGQQAVNLVDEEHLARADVAEDAGQVELLLQNRTGGLFEADAQFSER